VIFAKLHRLAPSREPAPAARPRPLLLPFLSLRRRVQLFRQLASLHRAGVPILEALSGLCDYEPSAAARQELYGLRAALAGGSSLQDAAAAQSKLFDRVAVALLGAGEASGRIAEAWEALADGAELRLSIRRQLVRGLFYPTILLVLGCFLLPLRLLLLEGVSSYLIAALTPLALGGAILGALLAARPILRRRFPGAAGLLERAPLLGRVLRRLSLARGSAILGHLLDAGLPIAPSMRSAGLGCGSVALGRAFERAAEGAARGETLVDSFRNAGQVPATFLSVVAAGERAGTLAASLRTFATAELHAGEHALQLLVRGTAIGFALLVFGYLSWRSFAQVTEVRENVEKAVDTILDGKDLPRLLDQFQELERDLR
jgi:type II secretory pathway component PulF